MRKLAAAIILLGLLVGGSLYYLSHDSRNRVQKMSPHYELESDELRAEFEANENAANQKYLGKLLAVEGNVGSIERGDGKITINLDTKDPLSSIVCELNMNLFMEDLLPEEGQHIQIKGECSGKLMDIILVNSVIVE